MVSLEVQVRCMASEVQVFLSLSVICFTYCSMLITQAIVSEVARDVAPAAIQSAVKQEAPSVVREQVGYKGTE